MIEIIRDKSQTRKLYEECFDDPESFVDYYYDDKCSDNIIVASREEDEVISMLHLNPYVMNVCDKVIKSYYIVAVATTGTRRHEGQMSKVFDKTFDILGKQHIPFVFLLPVDENIYRWLGFETVCSFRHDKIMNYERIKENFDVYCIQDEVYLRRMKKELELQELGDGEVLPDNPVIMAKVTDLDAFSEMAGQKFDSEKSALKWLKNKKIYICEEV
ncbi:MAG: GNAT family N-acetyltransferase [Butyrivibrio sp.]|nr:GNAT family N-acetyltransferase [Butyrivibrio sp.]